MILKDIQTDAPRHSSTSSHINNVMSRSMKNATKGQLNAQFICQCFLLNVFYRLRGLCSNSISEKSFLQCSVSQWSETE